MINHWEVKMQTRRLEEREIEMQHAWISRKENKKQIKLEKRND